MPQSYTSSAGFSDLALVARLVVVDLEAPELLVAPCGVVAELALGFDLPKKGFKALGLGFVLFFGSSRVLHSVFSGGIHIRSIAPKELGTLRAIGNLQVKHFAMRPAARIR